MAKQEKSAAELYREQRKARIAKAAKKNKKKPISPEMGKKIGKVVAVIVVLAILATIGGVAASYTGIIEQHRTAVMVGDIAVSQPEYSFYYNNAYSMANQYASYGINYDTTVTPDKQEYSDDFGAIEGFPEDETPMWTDYFAYYAKQRLAALKSAVAAAKERGLELDDADLAEVQSTIDSNASSAKSNGYSLSAYLRAYYGKGVSVKLYRTLLEEQTLMSKLSDVKQAELKEALSEKEVEEAYNGSLSKYAVASVRTYTISAETVADEESGTEQVTDETMAAAKERADAIVAASGSEKAFLAAIAKDAKVNNLEGDYQKDDSLTLKEDATSSDLSLSSEADSWLFSASTAAGDTYLDEDATSGYTIIYVVDPAHKPADSKTYDVRHILVKFPEADTESEDAAAEEPAVETLDVKGYDGVRIVLDVNAETATDKATYEKAQNILKEYLDGEHTEDAFAALAKKYSEDSNASEGGLYSDVEKGKMVSEFEDWGLSNKRKAGDVGIVETTYGYHVMYYVGSTSTPWDDQIRTDLTDSDLNAYFDDLSKDEAFTVTDANQKALDDVQAFIVRLARNQIRNAANSAS